MSPRIGKAELRKRALIGAALGEIAERGTLEVTVAQIARRAGVSSALAHHYFGGKDDLILATMRHLLAEFRLNVVGAMHEAEGPRARLSATIRASFGPEQFHHATISAWLTFYAWALSSPGAARLLRIYHRRLESNLTHALKAIAPAAEARRIAPMEVEYVEEDPGPHTLFSFEPDATTLFESLLPRYVATRIFAALLEAAASESASRRRAMKAASDNADDLIKILTLMANRERQDQITQEISEIVGGANALADAAQK